MTFVALMGRLLLCAGFWFAGAGLAVAHDSKAAISDMFFNDQTGLLEISHRLTLHDAEQVVSGGVRVNLLGDDSKTKLLETYVAGTFLVFSGETRKKAALEIAGSEIERGYIWVYQEVPIAALEEGLFIRNDMFQDAWPDQINTVNVRRAGEIKTLTFTSNSGLKWVPN